MREFEIPSIDRATVGEQAMKGLLELIRKGVFRPGDQFPPQRQLVEKMGLSRTVIREALRGLASMGIIEILPGKGVYVRRISPEMLVDPETLAFLLEKETLLHVIEVRKILEVEAIGLAAERATGEDLRELKRILEEMEQARTAGDNPLGHSSAFHLAIAKATHNPVLSSMVGSFVGLMAQAAKQIDERVPDARQREFPQHARLFQAIARRDGEEARHRMRRHLVVAERDVRKAFAPPGHSGTTAVNSPAP